MKENKFEFGNSGSYLELLNESNREENVLLSLSTDKKKNNSSDDERVDLYMNKSTAYLIFGQALLNCMTNGIESKFNFNNIYDINSDKAQSVLSKIENIPKDKDNIVIDTDISITRAQNSKKAAVKITIKYKYGFINGEFEKFDYITPEHQYNPNKLELEFKKCFDLISLVTLPQNQ